MVSEQRPEPFGSVHQAGTHRRERSGYHLHYLVRSVGDTDFVERDSWTRDMTEPAGPAQVHTKPPTRQPFKQVPCLFVG